MVPGLVEQQRIDVARRLDRAARHGEHVEAHEPVHARDADGGEQRADCRRDQRHEQRDQHDDGDAAARIGREARDAGDGEDEDDRHAREKDVQRDLVRRLLTLGAFDKRDHAVEEGRALARGDAHHDPVGYDERAARHRRAVAARLADHGRGLARDGRFVHRGDALDHLAVGRDEIARLDQHDVARLELHRGRRAQWRWRCFGVGKLFRDDIGLRGAQARGLRFAASLGDGFREVREQHREPEPEDDLQREAEIPRAA